ncbi:hypothetical protein CUMW_050490, partial [Citrus unshiu]
MSCYLISGCKLKESAVGNKNAVGSRKIFERKGKTASIKPWPAASLNRGYGCNNPFRTATAASPFAATGASVFRLDILLYLIERGNPGLATVRDDCGCNLLDALASKPSDFESGNIPVELNHISPLSAKVGVFIISNLCCKLLFNTGKKRFSILRARWMFIMGSFFSNSIDASNNNILHLAAELPPPARLRVISDAALQMQRELQWFKEIEKLVHPLVEKTPNVLGKTAEDVFMEQHKDLLEKREQWMKVTANSCMVVAALIATIMFAAAFTSFLVFAISDAPGLIFSSASLVTFLSIITARYAVEDFLDQLPRLLMRGLGLLFWAVATMMVASAAGFSIVVREGAKSVVKVVIVLAFLPVAAYALAQLPLCYKMYTMWTSGARGIFRPERILAH